jgi:hypothetical protein
VERTHLTSRHLNSRLVRKTLSYSKIVEMDRAIAAWEDIVYNLVRPLKMLRREASNDPTRRLASTNTCHSCRSDQSCLDC